VTTDRSIVDWARHLASPIPPSTLLAQLSTGSLTEIAAQTAQARGDQIALHIGESSLTHSELDERARRLAASLVSRGAGLGTRVVIAAPNSLTFAVAYLAALHTGSAVTLFHPSLRPRELHDLVDLIKPVVSIGSIERVDQLSGRKSAGSVVAIDGSARDSVDAAIATHAPLPLRALDAGTVAHLAFTSGTTGKPKLVPLTHSNIVASVRAIALAWRWDQGDVLVHGLPLHHAHGLTALHLSILTGSKSVVLTHFDPDALCETADQHDATVIFGVPSMYDRLVRSDQFNRQRLSHVRVVVSGSAPLPPTTFAAIEEAIGQPPLERYGLTEAGFVLSNEYDGLRRAGSVGLPLPGIELDLVDANGASVDDEIDGEIVVRGPQIFAGYLSDPGDADDPFLPHGWFRTGDLGRRSAETGAVSITGRLKELIVTGGFNVYPREVELVLEAQPGVAAAAVVGMPSDEWGEEVTAVIVAKPGAVINIDGLAATVREVLAPHKRPKRYHIAEDLPRNHMGKLMRAALADELRRGDSRFSSP
jgi:malonyl-CoA/methylmalonyl-CoA synthetase